MNLRQSLAVVLALALVGIFAVCWCAYAWLLPVIGYQLAGAIVAAVGLVLAGGAITAIGSAISAISEDERL